VSGRQLSKTSPAELCVNTKVNIRVLYRRDSARASNMTKSHHRQHHHQDERPRSALTLFLAVAAPTVFAVLAFAFAVLALTSKDWAHRDFFDQAITSPDQPLGPPPENWTNANRLYTEYRSPFRICVNVNESGIDVQCFSFKPSGFAKTSCELAVATQSNTAINYGDARL
jgi:hypothetical protein